MRISAAMKSFCCAVPQGAPNEIPFPSSRHHRRRESGRSPAAGRRCTRAGSRDQSTSAADLSCRGRGIRVLASVSIYLRGLAHRCLDRERSRRCLVAPSLGLDYLPLPCAASFLDVEVLRDYLLAHVDAPETCQVGYDPHVIPGLIAKIEKPEALDELEDIVRIVRCDGRAG